jgi:hypothetical protein
MTPGDIEIGLVQQRHRAEAQRGAGAMEVGLRQAMQLVVERGEQRVFGGAVPRIGARHQRGHDIGWRLTHLRVLRRYHDTARGVGQPFRVDGRFRATRLRDRPCIDSQ